MRQEAIEVPAPKEDSRSLHEVLVGVLKEFGPRKREHLVEQLKASKGHLSEVLDGTSGKHWPQPWIDYIVEQYDYRNEVATYYARKRGMEVRGPRPMSPAEELRRIKYALAQHNGLGKAIRDEAMALPDDVFSEEP